MIHSQSPVPPVAEPLPSPPFDHPLLEEPCAPAPASCPARAEPEMEMPPADVVMSEPDKSVPQLDTEMPQEVIPITPLSPDQTPNTTTPVAPSEVSLELVEAIVNDFQKDPAVTPEKEVLSESTPFKRVVTPVLVEIEETADQSATLQEFLSGVVDGGKKRISPSPLPMQPNEETTPTVTEEERQIISKDISSRSEAKSTKEALRIVVMTRLLRDRQTREERVGPVLLANQSRSQLQETRRPASLQEFISGVVGGGKRHQERLSVFASARPILEQQFKDREATRLAKVQRLRKEYQTLHEKWVQHCTLLDEQSRALASETETVQPAGRTTRRSAATLGDAVRSDLEMEQIIASLGNDEATDPAHLSLRNLATIPDMISVTHGKVDYVYDDTNHRVEEPAEYYGPHTGIHDWTEDEKKTFLDKFAEYPKQFGIIASFLPNKTQAQCVAFYYLHKKKMIDFRKVVSQYAPNKRRRRGTGKKKGIIADIQQHDAEVSGGVDLLTVPSRVSKGRKAAAQAEGGRRSNNPRRAAAIQVEGTPGSTPTPEPPEPVPTASIPTPTPTPTPTTTTTPTTVRNSNRRRRGQTQSSVQSKEGGEEDAAVGFFLSVEYSGCSWYKQDADTRPAKRVKRSRRTIKSASIVIEEPSTPQGTPSVPSTPVVPLSVVDAGGGEGKSQDIPDSTPGTRRNQSSSSASVAQWNDDDKSGRLPFLHIFASLI